MTSSEGKQGSAQINKRLCYHLTKVAFLVKFIDHIHKWQAKKLFLS